MAESDPDAWKPGSNNWYPFLGVSAFWLLVMLFGNLIVLCCPRGSDKG